MGSRKFYDHAHFVLYHAHFCTIETAIYYHEFLDEKINCKSSRIDLAAIEAHLFIIIPGICLEIYVVTGE